MPVIVQHFEDESVEDEEAAAGAFWDTGAQGFVLGQEGEQDLGGLRVPWVYLGVQVLGVNSSTDVVMDEMVVHEAVAAVQW